MLACVIPLLKCQEFGRPVANHSQVLLNYINLQLSELYEEER